MISLLLIALGMMQAAAAPFEITLWPGEGRPVFEAVASELVLREQPARSARIVERLSVRPRQRVEFGQTVYRTVTPGLLRAVTQSRIRGRRLGAVVRLSKEAYYSASFPQTELLVNSGDGVELLQYRAEGTCFVKVGDVVIDAESCPAQDSRTFTVESPPDIEWWIDVIVAGKPRGWVLVDSGSVKAVGRTF